MKLRLFFLVALFAALQLAAQKSAPYIPPSEVKVARMDSLRLEDKPYLKSVTLTGQLSTKGNSDFRQLRDLAYQVEHIDLSQATVDEIPNNAFHSRRNLRSIRLPQSIHRIGSQAFFACSGLERIVIPASVKEIGAAAFNGCVNLKEVIFEGQRPVFGPLAFHAVPVAGLQTASLPMKQLGLIPLPKLMLDKAKAKPLRVASIGRIVAPTSLHNEAAHLRRILRERAGLPVLRGKTVVQLLVDTTMSNAEAYYLDIDAKGITLKGGSPAGVFYGLMTMEQMLINQPQILPALHIEDAPRLRMRELMLDPCRTFIPFEELKRFVVEMSRYKLNALHLHLVDDQAWRIQIKAYPHLVGMSSQRPSMDDMRYTSPGFYTQAEMKELVAFAKKYHVEIIPEIEMPGHEVAAIHAYPELTCNAQKVPIRTKCGVSNELLCPSGAFTYEFLFKVFDELAEVFSSPYVHLGGDEAGIPPLANWNKCARCQSLKQELGVPAEDMKQNWKLQKYMFDRVIAHLRDKLGKTPMFWYETDFKEIQPGCIVFAWRHGLTNAALDAAQRNKAQVMLCPGEHCYLDYPMARGDMPEVNWGMPTTTLRKTYELNPAWGRSADFERQHIFGCAGTLWSECINTPERIYYQAFPRALALAEVCWTPQKTRRYDDFLLRLQVIQADQMQRGLSVSLAY